MTLLDIKVTPREVVYSVVNGQLQKRGVGYRVEGGMVHGARIVVPRDSDEFATGYQQYLDFVAEVTAKCHEAGLKVPKFQFLDLSEP